MTDTLIFLSIIAGCACIVALHSIGIARFFHIVSASAFATSGAWQAFKARYSESYSKVMEEAPASAYSVRVSRRQGQAVFEREGK